MKDPTALQSLMLAFRDGDPCAFEGLEPEVFVLCYRKARSLGARHEEAEDVAQEVVVGIWKTRARSFDPQRGSLEGWLAVTSANRLKDLWKRKDRQRRLESDAGAHPGDTPSPEGAVVQREEGDDVRKCLEQLTPVQREVLDRVKGGHTNREIAEQLGIPEARVRCVKFRGLQRMRQLLGRLGLTPLAAQQRTAPAGGQPTRDDS